MAAVVGRVLVVAEVEVVVVEAVAVADKDRNDDEICCKHAPTDNAIFARGCCLFDDWIVHVATGNCAANL